MKGKLWWGLIIIFGLALFFRTYHLDELPYGFHVDEVKAGWNAYSILKTGRDDKGNLLPLYYNSFGDYRPTGLMYLMIPFIAVLGRTILAVRLPFSLFGALSVIPLFLWVRAVSKSRKLALGSALLLALNPWHIITSRATSESIAAMFLALWGLYFWSQIGVMKRYRAEVLTVLSFAGAFLFYHNIRVLVPIFLWGMLILGKLLGERIYRGKLVVAIVLTMLVGVIFVSPQARGRMSQVGIKSDFKILYEVTKMPTEEGSGHVLRARAFHNRLVSLGRRVIEEYSSYFGTGFLTGDEAKPTRYVVPQVGLITYAEFILLIIGLFWVSKKKYLLVFLGLLALAPIPAAATIEDVPNLQRAIFMLPFLIVIMAAGIEEIGDLNKKWQWLQMMAVAILVINFGYFWHMYLIHQRMAIATYYRDGGNAELAKRLVEVKDNYEKIVLTNSPDDLYPWVAFATKGEAFKMNVERKNISNSQYAVGNFVFTKDKCPSEKMMGDAVKGSPKVLYVDAEGCEVNKNYLSSYKVTEVGVIRRPDNSPPYYLRTLEKI